ncbi:MAG: site-specific integrase [Patescibacteria group bacterium]|nr:site-specific integrase [Patescibacteria group bacterium]
MPRYIAEKTAEGARSYKSMDTSWRALASTFANLRPDQVTKALCRQYTEKRRSGGVSDGTIIKDLGVLKAALGWANKAGAADFQMPPTPPPRDRHLSREEFDRLLAACDASHIELFIILALSTAGRASALLELTWDQVDFERGLIRLSKGQGRQKGRSTVPMTERLRKALETAYSGRTSDYVIEWGGQPVKSVKRSFARACERAGIEGVTPHILRHTAAVWMAEAGVSMHEIAAFLGHTDPRITFRVYAKYSPDHLRKAASALE